MSSRPMDARPSPCLRAQSLALDAARCNVLANLLDQGDERRHHEWLLNEAVAARLQLRALAPIAAGEDDAGAVIRGFAREPKAVLAPQGDVDDDDVELVGTEGGAHGVA